MILNPCCILLSALKKKEMGISLNTQIRDSDGEKKIGNSISWLLCQEAQVEPLI